MKSELAKLIEVDASLGEISVETAKNAKSEAKGCATGLIVSFIISTGGLAAASGCLLSGHIAVGSSFGIVGLFFYFASRFFRREMEKWDAIVMAYNQRDKLREIRGDVVEYAIDARKPKKKVLRLR